MNRKRIISIILAVAMIIAVVASATLSINATEVTVILDGKVVECTTPARIDNGSTMVPMRAIFEAFGMEVSWNNEERSVTATKGNNEIKLTVGEKVLSKNGQEMELGVAPYIDSDTTLVPVRAVSESLDATVTWHDKEKQVEIATKDFVADPDAWKENEGEINLTNLTVSGDGVSVEENIVKIVTGGDFTVTGENTNAMIHVNTYEKVKLRLNGVNLANEEGPAIFFENSMESLITISKGSENFVADGGEYSVDAKAAIFSNDDIEIKGEGTLTVTSKAHHAIASDDDIKIEEGTLILTSEAKDGIHANNTIKLKGGNIIITAYGDGIQAEEDIIIENGEINVTTIGKVETTNRGWGEMSQGGFGGNRGSKGNRDWSNMGQMMPPEGFNGQMPPEGMIPPEGMENMIPPEGFNRQTPPEGMIPSEDFGAQMPEKVEDANEDETVATKGIKAETDITITGGKIVVNANDHAIHSAATISIKGGEMTLASNYGKGISAHGDVVIDDGKITVVKASEGLESKANFTINGGEITINGSDDGINAGGTGGRDVAQRQNSDQATGHDLIINGGKIFVNAQGDGLDANGRMIINGGDIVVEGPTNNGNGALDSGGVIKVNGGTLIALGASGMAEAPGSDSTQLCFRLVTDTTIVQGSEIKITNAAGELIYSYTTQKTGNSIVFSSDKLTKGETYLVKIAETEHSVTLTDIVTNIGNGGFGGFGGGRGGRW